MENRSARLWLGICLAVALAVVVVKLRSRSAGDSAHAAARDATGPRLVPVAVASAVTRDVPIWLEGLGNVAAWQQVTVRAQVDGRLDKVLFKEGQSVHRGDVLAEIDPRPFAVQLHQAEGAMARDKAQLANARLNLDRYRALVAQKLIAQQQVDDQTAVAGQAEGAVHADEAQIESARLNLDYARVKAPLDGVVGVRLVDAGNLVHATDANGLVVIAQLDPAALFVTLPEDDLPRVMAAMQRGDVTVEAWSRDGSVALGTGKLAVVDNQINAATATLRLKCRVPNPEHKLWPNQFVKARLLLETRAGAIVIPPAAVQRGPQGAFVYVVVDGKAELRPVQIALTTADLAVVDRGVRAGDQVVVEGQNQLRPGVPVAARPVAGSGNVGSGNIGARGGDANVGSGNIGSRGGDANVGSGNISTRGGGNVGSGNISTRGGDDNIGSGNISPRGGSANVGSGNIRSRGGDGNVDSGNIGAGGGDGNVGSGNIRSRGGDGNVGSGNIRSRGGDGNVGSGNIGARGGSANVGSGNIDPRGAGANVGSGNIGPRGGNPNVGSGNTGTRGVKP
jgi:multidrug efflux system membrane fusion protein